MEKRITGVILKMAYGLQIHPLHPFALEHLNGAAHHAADALRRGSNDGELSAAGRCARGERFIDLADKRLLKRKRIAAVDDDMAGIQHPEHVIEHVAGNSGSLQERRVNIPIKFPSNPRFARLIICSVMPVLWSLNHHALPC